MSVNFIYADKIGEDDLYLLAELVGPTRPMLGFEDVTKNTVGNITDVTMQFLNKIPSRGSDVA